MLCITVETVQDLHVKLKSGEKRADDVSHEKYGLKARSKHSQRVQSKVNDSSTQAQSVIGRFRAGLKEGREFAERRGDEKGLHMLSQIETWTAG